MHFERANNNNPGILEALSAFPLKPLSTAAINQNNCRVVIVDPSLKNNVSLNSDGEYGNFISVANKAYDANKQHTSYNFVTYCRAFDLYWCISKCKKIDDIADAFMMAYAWITHCVRRTHGISMV
jgi:hypothetical protein